MRQPRSHLAQQRRTAGYTQEALAYEVGVDRSTVARWESGETEPQPWLRLKLARVLGITATRLSELLIASGRMAPPGPGAVGRSDAVGDRSAVALTPLRRAMLGNPIDRRTAPAVAPAGVYPDIKAAAVAVHTRYQRADYEASSQLVPLVVSHLDDACHSSGGDQPPPILHITAVAYLAAAKIANKLGDLSMAMVAADRALRYAKEARHAALIALAKAQFACALLRANHGEEAEQMVANATERLALTANRERTPETISAQGSLLLLLAVIASLRGDGIAAKDHLGKADHLSNQLGHDGNWLWTGFGPTNVRIHELAVLVGLGETKRALQLGPAIDTDRLPTVLRGRRAQVHVELAQAAAGQAEDGLSVLHLLEAERVATQAVSHHAEASGLLRTLLGRERKGTTPGLRALATRAGMLS